MEIDPEVAELLNDLPPTALPDELVAHGWGRYTAKQMINAGLDPPHEPSSAPAPQFLEHCKQCGRPVATDSHGMWRDHAGRTKCDRGLAEEQRSRYHFVVDPFEPIDDKYIYKPIQIGPCLFQNSWERRPDGHIHKCAHSRGHFGFHECKTCRHLWG